MIEWETCVALNNTITDAKSIVFINKWQRKAQSFLTSILVFFCVLVCCWFTFFFFLRNSKLNIVQTFAGLSLRVCVQSMHTGTPLFSLNNIISTIALCCHWENRNISTKKNKLHLCSHFNSQFLTGVVPGQCFKVLTISF